ncbi:MAG: glycosyltransferase family 39 protein, partial [Phycisphaerales bacterium]
MPRGETRRVNSLWFFALLAALCCSVPCLHPFVSGVMAPRELLVDISPGAAGTGDEASLMWTRNADGVRDGYWIDLVPLRALPAPVTLTYRLPSYPVHEVTISVADGSPEALGISRVREQSWFLGYALPKIDVSPMPQGSGLQLTVPPRRWWTLWPARAGLAGLVGVLAFGLFVVMWRVSTVWEDLWTALVVDVKPPPRWLLGLLAFLVVAAPTWMVIWSPMLMEGDGAGFMWFACHFWQDFKLSHFDGWRLPGYSVIIAPLVGLLDDYANGIGVMQAIFGVLTSVMVWDLLRRRISQFWSLACAALVACDPMLLMWQRHVLSETTATVMVTGLVWLVSRVVLDRRSPPGRVAEQVGIPVLLGVACAAAIYTRANFQTFLVVVPGALCFAALLRGRRVLAFTPGVLVVVIAATLLAPAFIRNREVLRRTELIVGAGHNRCVFSWQNGTIEYNQTRSVSFPRYRELRSKVDAHQMWELAYTDFLADFGSIPVPEGTPWVTTRELRSDEVTQESMARMSDVFARRIAKGFFSILGVWFREPWYYSHTVDNMSRVLRGKFDDRTKTTFDDFYDLNLLPEDVRAAVVRVRRP